jgi:choline dehydrogenase-like flavoprotein
MANLNIDSQNNRTYDAIVIGSGASGGWAAKELCQKGLRTLVLERGPDVPHVTGYPSTMLMPWEFEHRNQLKKEVRDANPIISKCYAFYEGTEQFFVKDAQHPYVQEKPFDWIRGYQVGGKSLMWARMTQRWSDHDFGGPARDGYAVDWPIRYKDIAPWYTYVEKFAGISGNKDGLDTLPDGHFQPPFELNCVEKYFKEELKKHYNDRHLIIGRCAHITKPTKEQLALGRGTCQHRTICERGCPFGGYFASNSTTIIAAQRTGRMTLRPHSVVHSIIYDEKKKRATGVRLVDANTGTMMEYNAKIIFLNAATLNSNLVLLNSTSSRFPNGLGNDSGTLGKYVAFHLYRAHTLGIHEGNLDSRTEGRRPTGGYIPRFRNVYKQETDYLRGYAVSFGANRQETRNQNGIGAELKDNLTKTTLGNWSVNAGIMGETIPKASNFVTLDKTLTDPHGIPQLRINVDYDSNDEKMIKDFFDTTKDMFERAGFKNIRTTDSRQAPGLDIHEMGGIRAGHSPATSMLNAHHQLHACPNVFVTDGASMTSTSTQNPTLTYMAFTARAADYAVKQLKALKL